MTVNIFDYIKTEEAAYKTTKVTVSEGYEWSMYEHIRMSTLFRDSKYTKGADDLSRPFKNIIRRIITLQHVATGFDVKDIEPFVNESKNFHKSFLTRKFHPKWARKHNLDTFIDELVESYVDFGLSLVKHVNKVAPEVVPLQSIAFCDQTDILSGPICIKHQYSPAQLKEMEKYGWGDEKNGATTSINELITLARKEKVNAQGVVTKTPGKFIEVYEIDGTFPKDWMKDEETTEAEESTYTQQFALIAFYQDDNGDKKGLKLFHKKGDPNKYKALKRDPIFGRACGFGGIEELFQPQIWTNYNTIRIQGMLDATSKVLGVTDDSTFATANKFTDLENGEWLTLKEGKTAAILDNRPVNVPMFENANAMWESHAQGLGSANDAQLGESPASGTPFKLQELVTYQGKGPHEYRKGKVAIFLGECYRDWFLEDLVKEMNDEQEFMEELSLEELQYVADRLVDCKVYEHTKEQILNGEIPDDQEIEELKTQVREEFMKGGSKRFFSLLKDELKALPVDVDINIAGKQKNLVGMADKLSSIFGQMFANPQGFVQVMQIPGASDTFNSLLESSGLSPMRFAAMSKEATQQIMQPQPTQLPTLETKQPVTA